jgi:UDP-N-acetylglucosamine 2-epimerase
MDARFIMTDSSGVQEKTMILGIQYLILCDSTERLLIVSEGTNILVSNDRDRTINEAFEILNVMVKGEIYPISGTTRLQRKLSVS